LIVRATDAALHNYIANHPEVKPTFGYQEGFADLTPLLEYPEQYILLSDGIGAASIFEWTAPRVWQGHSMFLPESRGRDGIAAGKAMLAWMFERGGAKMLWGMTPIDNRPAQMFNRLLGFKPAGERINAADRKVRLFVMEN
jgi:RimJ/RimL family protein N-acetyltransferase